MRDPVEEARMLEEGAALCQRVFGQQSPSFNRRMAHRLQLGAPHRACEVVLDQVAAAILDYERSELADTEREELRQATLGVIACAVNLDAEVRRLHSTLDDLLT